MPAQPQDFGQILDDSLRAIESLRPMRQGVERAAEVVSRCLRGGHKLLACGNGGSSADAAHFATEFVVRFVDDRRPYPAIALGESGGTLTAIGNDYHYDQSFARQVRAFAQKGDVLVVFTTSGKSPSIVKALEAAKEAGIESVALLGRDGGACRGKADVELIVPHQVTARIQEAHMVLLHLICDLVERTLPR